jgi:hypothetical protein
MNVMKRILASRWEALIYTEQKKVRKVRKVGNNFGSAGEGSR